MFLAFYRSVRTGFQSFWRDRWVSTATVGVMSLTLFIITGVMLLSMLAGVILKLIEKKMDISIYFKKEATQEQILAVKSDIMRMEQVAEVNYISSQQALVQFKQAYKSNPIIQESLKEVGENPLEASLEIQAKEPSQYEEIVSFIHKQDYKDLIDKITYNDQKKIIQRLDAFTSSSRKAGIFFSLILIVIAVLVSFNTIRLAIYDARERIMIMRLVGSDNWFIRGPFLVEGVLYGVISAFISFLAFYLLLVLVAPKINPYFSGLGQGVDILGYYTSNASQFLIAQIGIGIGLGLFSSWFAIRRYLKT